MRSHRWKLVLAAGLILTAMLIQQNVFRSTSKRAPIISVIGEAPPKLPDTVTPATPAATASLARTETTVPSTKLTAAVSPVAAPATSTPLIYKVEQGNNPLSIAKRFGISVESLLATNQITDPTTLQIGQQLIIPILVTPNPELSTLGLEATPSPSPTMLWLIHTVQKGDTVSSVAAEYGTNSETIVIANHIQDPASLQVGQRLLILPDHSLPPGLQSMTHRIEPGDTLLGLAAQYDAALDDILIVNPELEPTLLQVGQEIAIPLNEARHNPTSETMLSRITSPEIPLPELVAREQEMVKVVNTARQIRGLLPLFTNEELTTVARAHAQDMVARGYFDHVTPEGKSLQDRLGERGLAFDWVGENIQRNTQPASETTQYAADWFMNSEPHRNNILNHQFEQIGVGVAEGPPGWFTFVLEFASGS